MGLFFSNLLNRCHKQMNVFIVMTGLQGSGKTTLLYRTIFGKAMSAISSGGYSNLEYIEYKGFHFTIWEGLYEDRKWRCLLRCFPNKRALIFVVDSSDRDKVEEARYQLHNLLSELSFYGDVLLVLANKSDLSDGMDNSELIEKLKLNSLQRSWHIESVSAKNGYGLYKGLDWILKEISKSQG